MSFKIAQEDGGGSRSIEKKKNPGFEMIGFKAG